MIQLVELVTVDNENLAYHYASDDIDAVFNYEKKFNDLTKDIPLSFSSHILATEDSTFDSLCEKDPYFKQFRNYSDLTSFVKKTQEKSAFFVAKKLIINKTYISKLRMKDRKMLFS